MCDAPYALTNYAPNISRPQTAKARLVSIPRPKTAAASASLAPSSTAVTSPIGAVMPSRNGSTASSTSPVDSAAGSLWKSPSSLSIRKTRRASITAPPVAIDVHTSPKKQARLSRSLTNESIGGVDNWQLPRVPTWSSQESKGKTLQKKGSEPVSGPIKGRPPGLRMLSSSFHPTRASEQRRPSEPTIRETAPMATNPQPGYSPLATYNHIHETTNKRMATLDYLRKVHEGQIYYFSTISYNQSCISAIPSLHPSRLGRRATNYFLLGSSITPLLEFYASNPLDYLRSLAALLAEFDTYAQLSLSENGSGSFSKNRMGAMFKRGVKPKRQSNADAIFGEHGSVNGSSSNLSSIADSMPLPPASHVSHDFQYLQTPLLPFDPDFSTSFGTLIDILMEAYSGLLTLLQTPEACAIGVAEAFAKADKQMKKVMLGGIVTEFGDSTRVQAKSEVGGLGKLVLSGLM